MSQTPTPQPDPRTSRASAAADQSMPVRLASRANLTSGPTRVFSVLRVFGIVLLIIGGLFLLAVGLCFAAFATGGAFR